MMIQCRHTHAHAYTYFFYELPDRGYLNKENMKVSGTEDGDSNPIREPVGKSKFT